MGESFHFNGVDMSDYGLVVAPGSRVGMPGLEIPTLEVAGRHGAFRSKARFRPRSIQVPCTVHGTGYADVQAKMDGIKLALAAVDPKPLSFDIAYPSNRYFLATLQNEFMTETRPNSQSFTLDFFCADPFAYLSGDEEVEVLTFTASGQTKSTGVIAGTASVFGVWLWSPSGSAGSFAMENLTADVGTSTTYGSYTSSNDIRFTPERDLCERNTSGGAFDPSMATYGGSPPWLRAGIANDIKITGSAGTLTITYRPRFA